MISVKMTGLDEFVANLRALPAELVGKGGGPIREALFAVAKVVRDDARVRAPYDEEGYGKHLRDEIIMKRDPDPRSRGDAAERYIVTVKYKDKKYKNNRANRRSGRVGSKYQNFGDFYYWRMMEFGHHAVKKDGSAGEWVQHPFLRPAFEANKSALPGIARDKLAAGIARIVGKMKT